MVRSRSLLALAGWSVSIVAATDIVYVTDLSIFTVLAPCAQAAVSGIIDYETVDNCPTAAAELQSCICSKNTCGSTATDDQASAATILNAYCNQDAITPFPSPSHTVSQYVVDLPAYHQLAPCAQTGLGGIVLGMTWDKCQADASLLATCACEKNQNSAWASSQIESSVKENCEGHTEDVASAQAVFSGYCGLVEGTTSFPTTSDPPGNVNYYITALKEYQALASCAQMAVSAHVLELTQDLCPTGAKALASCACLRSDMTGPISSSITSDVRYYCSPNPPDDISSALDVWDLYCSAAKGLTTPAGITQTVPDDTSASETQSSRGVQQTNKPGASGASSGGSANGTTPAGQMTTSSNTAVIAGAVVGAVVGTALIAVVAFLLYRRSKKAQQAAAAAGPDVPESDKPELDSTSVAPPPTHGGSPSPSIMKHRMENSSPISAISSPYAAPPMPELHSQNPATPELQGHSNTMTPPMSELHSQAPRTPELQGHDTVSPMSEAYSQQVYEAPGQYSHTSQSVSQHQTMGWQSGPIPQAYEMDGSDSRRHMPHAQ
ncbi:hypothetical protein F4777DRAFT_227624 [Nemania sp. FL0916]|nr:hypothetical protein F4777DRAFT_227624 [Nemania sp. FL0916]